mgnify:CR=1 FL=1
MGAHARFSPSAANRLIHCPPSLVLGEERMEQLLPSRRTTFLTAACLLPMAE